MPKTFNRQVWSVNYPTKNDVKNYFFNQAEFKGIDENNNVLTVDQQTFADTNNVYIDSNGLLKSRPSIKHYAIKDYNKLGKIVKTWTFGKYMFYFVKHDLVNNYSINVIRDGMVVNNITGAFTNVELVLANNIVYIFTDKNNIITYDLLSGYIGSSKPYIPITKVISGSVSDNNESPNVLTTSERWVYLYSNEIKPPQTLYGKQVKFKIGEDTYNRKIYQNDLDVLVEKSVTDLQLTDTEYRQEEIEFIAVSNNNTYARYNIETNTLQYIVNGVVMKDWSFTLPAPVAQVDAATKVADIQFDETGAYIFLLVINHGKVVTDQAFDIFDDKIYVVSCLKDNSTNDFKYKELTDITEDIAVNTAYCVGFKFRSLNDFILINSFYDSKSGNSITVYKSGSVFNKYVDYWHADRYDNGEYYLNFNYAVKNICYDGVNFAFSSNEKASIKNKGTQEWGNSEFLVFGIIKSNDIILKSIETFHVYQEWEPIEDYYYKYRILDADCKILNNVCIFSAVQNGAYKTKVWWYTTAKFTDETILLNDEYGDLGKTIINSITKPTGLDGPFLVGVSVSNDLSKILTSKTVYNISTGTEQSLYVPKDLETDILGCVPLAYTNYIHFYYDTSIFSSNISNINISFEYTIDGDNQIFVPTHHITSNATYFSHSYNLEINSDRYENNEFLWYFPAINTQTFNYPITNLYPISEDKVGIFFDNEIWYSTYYESNYYYNKSKLQLGCKEGNDIISLYDGSKIIFSSDRGLVAMGYQDFVASEDQVLTVLSDAIYNYYKSFNKTVKLLLNDMWLMLYNGSNQVLILDLRNMSWWKQSYSHDISFINKYLDNVIFVIDNSFYTLDKNYTEYYDLVNNKKEVIDWFVTSQRLHLNAQNYYKHIVNISLLSIIDETLKFSYKLDIVNYRKETDDGKTENDEFLIDNVRTYIKRLNYSKVNQFQYTLRRDNDNSIQIPLSLSSISIKYKIAGQVR